MTLPMSESDLQSAVIDLAKLRKWRVFHDQDARRNAAGLPDLIMVRNGRVVIAELKSEKGRLRPEQAAWLADLAEAAAVSHGAVSVHVWRPADLRSGVIAAVLAPVGDTSGRKP